MAGVVNSHPSNLALPVGADADALAVQPKPMDIPMAQPQADQAVPQGEPPVPLQGTPNKPSLDDIFGDSQTQTKPSLDDIFGKPEEPVSDETASFLTRAKAGLASDDTQKEAYLKQEYGKENVKKTSSGEFIVREDDKWKHFNTKVGIPGVYQGDPANLSRAATFAAGALPGELMTGAAVAGEAVSGAGMPAVLPTLAAGQFASGAAGEYAARGAADYFGLPRTEKTMTAVIANDAAAAGMAGGINALFGHVLNVFGGSASAGEAMHKLNPMAKQSATDAVDHFSAPLRAQTEAALENINKPYAGLNQASQLKSVAEDAEHLNALAKKAGLDLTPEELYPNSPQAQVLAATANKSKVMQDWRLNRGKVADGLVDKFGETVAQGDANALPEIIKNGSAIDYSVGQAIGARKQKALAESGDQLISVANREAGDRNSIDYATGFNKAATELGFIDSTGKPKFSPDERPSVSDLARDLGMEDAKVAWLHKFMVGENDAMVNGKGMLTLKELNQRQSMLVKQIDNALDNQNNLRPAYSNSYVKALINLKNGARDSFTNGLGDTLGAGEKAGFLADKAQYGAVKDALESMGRLFDKEQPTAKYTIDYITKSPAEAPARIDAFKLMFAKEKPEAIDSLKAAYWQNLKSNHMKQETDLGSIQRSGGLDASKMLNTLKAGSSQREIFEKFYGKEDTDSFIGLVKTLGAIQNSDKPYSGDAANGLFKRLLMAGSKFFKGHPSEAIDLFSSNSAALRITDGVKREKLLNELKGSTQSTAQKILSGVTQVAIQLKPKPRINAAGKAINMINHAGAPNPEQQQDQPTGD